MEKPTLSTYDKVAAAMTPEQKETYNYLLGKFSDGYTNEYGTDYADAYFELVRAGIQQDEAAAFHKKYLEGQWYEGVWSVVQGLDRTATGLQNAFGKLDTDDRTFDPQAVGALVSEDLGKKETPLWYNFAEGKWETKVLGKTAAQMGYDLATTTSAMGISRTVPPRRTRQVVWLASRESRSNALAELCSERVEMRVASRMAPAIPALSIQSEL